MLQLQYDNTILEYNIQYKYSSTINTTVLTALCYCSSEWAGRGHVSRYMLTVPQKLHTGATNNQPTAHSEATPFIFMTRTSIKKASSIFRFPRRVFPVMPSTKSRQQETFERRLVPPHSGGDSTIQRSTVYQTKQKRKDRLSKSPRSQAFNVPRLTQPTTQSKPTRTGAKTKNGYSERMPYTTRHDRTTTGRNGKQSPLRRDTPRTSKTAFHGKNTARAHIFSSASVPNFSRHRHHRQRRGTQQRGHRDRTQPADTYTLLAVPVSKIHAALQKSPTFTSLHRPSAKEWPLTLYCTTVVVLQ